MGRKLQTNIEIEVDARYDDERSDDTTVEDHHDWQLTDKGIGQLTDGTGETSANRLWHNQIDLSSGNNWSRTLDLAGGIKDNFGNTLTLSEIKGLVVHNESTTTGRNVSIGGASSAFDSWLGATDDVVLCGPQGTFAVMSPQDGYAVTAGSGDELRLDSGGQDVVIEVTLFGDE